MFKKLLLCTFLIIAIGKTFAQPGTEEQLATQYYQNKDFDKALDLYEKLYNKVSPQVYFTPYLNCLVETKDFSKAEKIAKKQIRQFPQILAYWVDLGIVYLKSDNLEKAKQTWEQAIKLVKFDDQVFTLANAFLAVRQFDYAISTYQKGRKISTNSYPFSFEIANAYHEKGDKTAMINEYLDILEMNDSFIQSVQNSLQTNFSAYGDEKQNEILKTELLKRIARNPDKTILSELLIWMQLQLRDFEGAFIQGKALDKRKKEDGSRIIALAQLFVQNDSYGLAEKAYQYLLTKGKENPYYTQARMEYLNVSYHRLTTNATYTVEELNGLEQSFNSTLNDLGKSAATISIIKNYAHLLAFYLHKTIDAIMLLEEAIVYPKLEPTSQAECKLELADILLMTGDVWEASLRYSQVEKSFKYDVIGQEAKFRVAKISYYTGDFVWAQAQLDVLKGATSKLISNDAMELSLLISDALAVDSNQTPLLIYARADLLNFQNQNNEAVKTLDSINSLFPNHALADEVLYKKSQIACKKGDFVSAIQFLESITKNYSSDILADDAIFKLAEIYELQYKDIEKAKEYYKKLIEDYSNSLYIVEARKRYRQLRGDTMSQ
jgi:tetratricopeptide (TPR) repeat protein